MGGSSNKGRGELSGQPRLVPRRLPSAPAYQPVVGLTRREGPHRVDELVEGASLGKRSTLKRLAARSCSDPPAPSGIAKATSLRAPWVHPICQYELHHGRAPLDERVLVGVDDDLHAIA